MSDWTPWRTHYQGPTPNARENSGPDVATRMVLMATYERGEHVCACAYLGENAPCGHCTECPDCNCQRCQNWHDTASGETCPKLTEGDL